MYLHYTGAFVIYLKVHDTEKGTIIAMCDEKLIGTILNEGKAVIDLDKYSGFYKGDLVSNEEAQALIENSSIYTANIVGKEAVDVFVRSGLAKEEEIGSVDGVPFVQVFNVE